MKYLGLFILLSLMSCGPELPDSQTLIDEIYNVKVASLYQQKDLDCREEAQAAAQLRVDSIVHRLLNNDLLDTINFPTKPVKPKTPEHIIGTVKKFDIK